MNCTVTGIFSYPVKSCRGTSVDAANVSPGGIDGDRQLMIVKDRAFTNQARLRKLATVATTRIDALTIDFADPEGATLRHGITAEGNSFSIDFYGNPVAVVDQGDAVAAFVSATIGDDVRVVALEDSFTRRIPLDEFSLIDGSDQSRFIDVAPLLVTNEASLADLNGRLDTPVPMNRFRPNLVITGLDAFAEDEIQVLKTDNLRLLRTTHCERCAVTCTDQETGERAREPLATLKSYRHRENGYAGGVMFGAYMAVDGSGTLRVGDLLEVETAR